MKYIVITYGASSSILYVQEALIRGYMPIIVNPPIAYDPQEDNFKNAVGDKVITIDVKDESEFDSMIDELKKYDIACVVAGAEGGVVYAERIADKLGMISNGLDTLYKRNTKRGMQDALRDSGLRYTETLTVTCDQDIIDFWNRKKPKKVFMKYSEGGGSVGSQACNSIEECIEHFKVMTEGVCAFGMHSPVLLQEYIEGEEYIVNSVSCDGVHVITDLWKYKKIVTNDNNVIYESASLIMNLGPGMHDLINYAYKVLTATGFKYGPCHAEYKIDENGPILIEVNCRPMGASMISSFLDEALGHHITDISLDSYLNKEKFFAFRYKPYRPRKMAVMKFFISLKDVDVNMIPIKTILYSLKSFRYCNPEIEDKMIHFTKTKDLETSPLSIKLCHRDPNVVKDDLEFLNMLELNYFDLLFCVDKKIAASEIDKDAPFYTLKYVPLNKTALIVTNDGDFVSTKGTIEECTAKWGLYDVVIYAYTKERTLEDIYSEFMKYTSQLRCGGYLIVYPEVFENIPYKAVAIEVLLKLYGFEMNINTQDENEGIIAIKH